MESKPIKYNCVLDGISAKVVLSGYLTRDGKVLSGKGFTFDTEYSKLTLGNEEYKVSSYSGPRLAAKQTKTCKVAKVAAENIDTEGNKKVQLLPTNYSATFANWLAQKYEKSDGAMMSYEEIISAFSKENCLHITNAKKIGAKSVVTKAVNKLFRVGATCKDGYPISLKQTN